MFDKKAFLYYCVKVFRCIARSSNGRTSLSESEDFGSNPSLATIN